MKFSEFHQRAIERKGEQELQSRLPRLATTQEIEERAEDRFLSDMTKCVFRAGFVWRIIDQKWDGFEQAFKGFIPRYWQQVPPEVIEELGRDTRIVRNLQKIATVPQNAFMIMEVSETHGSFGKFLADWPSQDQVGLMLWLKKNGSRLGGATAQFFLRMQGWDGFITSADVITALENHRLIDANPTSKTGLKQIQAVFNQWHEESELPYAHMSRILSMTLDARA